MRGEDGGYAHPAECEWLLALPGRLRDDHLGITQGRSETLSGAQWHSVAVSGDRGHSEAVSSTQGNQWR